MTTPTQLLRAIIEHFDETAYFERQLSGPGHNHTEPGLWDADHSVCEWCATWAEARRVAEGPETSLGGILAELLREAETRADLVWKQEQAGAGGFSAARNDAAALRRVIELVRGGAGRDARAREGTPATPEKGANPSPSTKES